MEVETALINMSKSLEMLWGISERKKEALLLCFRMRQQASHGDDDDEQWIQVGGVMLPLSMEHNQKMDGESEEDHVEGGEEWEAKMDALNTDYGAAVIHSSNRLL